MDYVVGSVAALITGNVTPNRPRLLKRALTPTKHQLSPNVTPKSEFVEDRSIFLSPTMQKKKAIVKKSPKRIFQNPDLETTENGENNLSLTSPKADKVKKHLKEDLEGDNAANKSMTNSKSPKTKGNNKQESVSTQESNTSAMNQEVNESTPKKKKKKQNSESESIINENIQSNVSTTDVINTAENTKKKKQRRKSVLDTDGNKENNSSEKTNEPETPNKEKSPKKHKNKSDNIQPTDDLIPEDITNVAQNPKKKKQKHKSVVDTDSNKNNNSDEKVNEPGTPSNNVRSPKKQKNKSNNLKLTEKANEVTETIGSNTPKKKNRKRKKKSKAQAQVTEENSGNKDNVSEETNKENKQIENTATQKKKNNKRKKSKGQQNKPEPMETDEQTPVAKEDENVENTISKSKVNPNAITDKESDSEHESDNEIESENEEINKNFLESEKPEESSDEEEEVPQKVEKKVEKPEDSGVEKMTEDEIKRTLFVGNVPFSAKCKKDIKKIFNKHGQIETIRIRTVPIKDGRYTPKLAVIKNELHPERNTVNVYIKYADAESVEKALVENNTLLNDHHLRVSRSSSTGAEHDPRCSVFIGNLPFAMEDEALRAKFEKCGEIHSVRIIRDKKTNAGKGFGYVNFESKDGVELALALTEEDLTVKNRILRVKRCTQTTNKKKPFATGHNQMQQRGGFKSGNNQMNQQRGGFRPGNKQDNQQKGGFNKFNKFNNQRNQGQKDEEGREGAFRRIMHKRKNQEGTGGDEPPNKRQKNINQPHKEKKSRKEFVGMTAEKKKKRKFDKGQKKKKALSEILTK